MSEEENNIASLELKDGKMPAVKRLFAAVAWKEQYAEAKYRKPTSTIF